MPKLPVCSSHRGINHGWLTLVLLSHIESIQGDCLVVSDSHVHWKVEAGAEVLRKRIWFLWTDPSVLRNDMSLDIAAPPYTSWQSAPPTRICHQRDIKVNIGNCRPTGKNHEGLQDFF